VPGIIGDAGRVDAGEGEERTKHGDGSNERSGSSESGRRHASGNHGGWAGGCRGARRCVREAELVQHGL
jgi:hypothetical protein